MKIKLEKLNNDEIYFFSLYTICLIVNILSSSFYGAILPGEIFEYIPPICVFLLLGREIIHQKMTIKAFIGGVFTIVCILIIANVSNNTRQASVFYMLFILFVARNIQFEKIARISAHIIGITLLFVILSAWAGIITNYVDTELRVGTVRYYLGFTYTLYAPALLLNYSMLKCYVWNETHTIRKAAFLLGINYCMYYFTQARLSFFLSIVITLVFCFINRTDKSKKKRYFVLLVPIFVLCFLVSVWLTITYNGNVEWMHQLNAFLGSRLSNMQKSILLYGVSFFGENIEWVGAGLNIYGTRNLKNYLYVDCVYVQMLQHYGIIFTIFFLLICTLAQYRCYKAGKYKLMLFLALIAVHGLIDDLVLYMEYNTFWFAMVQVLMMQQLQDMHLKSRDKV